MLKKLEAAEEKYLNIEAELASPDAFSNQEKFTALMKEYKNLTPIIEKFREYKKTCSDNEEAKLLLDESQDAELKELASAELKETKSAMERLFEELKILLLPKDPNDEKNVIVEIRSGAG
ncbi:MAG: PCRF domain-containing protein, partial [Clostridia bacterium]|nr:PCRF domain-containing protein [Clostridia bacterium]